MTYSSQILETLVDRFGEENVKREWAVATGSQDDFTRDFYCPQLDFAVGPFNIEGEIETVNKIISNEYNANRNLINRLRRRGECSGIFRSNKNPRCFLAIEAENTGSMKHHMGSMINASALGKVGILITTSDENQIKLVRIKEYLDFIHRVGKTGYNIKNVIIIKLEDFLEVL